MTTIPRFGSVDLNGDGIPTDAKKQFDDHFHQVGHSAGWQTPEHILVPPLFGSGDLDGLDFLTTRPGIAPYLRGPYATMYVNQPWTIRQYAGFSTAEESNAFYRRNLAAGQKRVAVFIVTHTFDITMAVFDVAQHVVSGASGVISSDTSIDVESSLTALQGKLKDMEIPELLRLSIETGLVSISMKIMSVFITVVIYGRMIEIYLVCSVAPIPFATMTNKEWGQIGNNYLKSLFALGFQGFLIMVCVGIYAVLVKAMTVSDNLHTAIFSLAAYTVLLCFMLLKSSAISKSIFGAH